MIDSLLRVSGLAVRINRNTVLHDVSFEVGTGEAVALLGPNGAGKTTLMRTISGILHPTSGSIVFDGKAIDSLSAWDVVRLGISHVPQGRRCFGPLTVLENLKLGSYTTRQKFQTELDKVLDLFPELRNKLKDRASSLSGGQQQMLAIGRALMSEPRMLLLDEPSLGLSPLYVSQLAKHLSDLRSERGLTILLVEQNLAVVQAVASEYFLIRSGRTESSAQPIALLDEDMLAEAYLSVS